MMNRKLVLQLLVVSIFAGTHIKASVGQTQLTNKTSMPLSIVEVLSTPLPAGEGRMLNSIQPYGSFSLTRGSTYLIFPLGQSNCQAIQLSCNTDNAKNPTFITQTCYINSQFLLDQTKIMGKPFTTSQSPTIYEDFAPASGGSVSPRSIYTDSSFSRAFYIY